MSEIIPVGLDVTKNVFLVHGYRERRHQPRPMVSLKKKAPNVMCAAAGLHRNNTGWKPIQKVQQPMPLEVLAKHDRACFVQPNKTTDGLAQINCQDLDVHQMHLSPPMSATIAALCSEGSSSNWLNIAPSMSDCTKSVSEPILPACSQLSTWREVMPHHGTPPQIWPNANGSGLCFPTSSSWSALQPTGRNSDPKTVTPSADSVKVGRNVGVHVPMLHQFCVRTEVACRLKIFAFRRCRRLLSCGACVFRSYHASF